MNGPPLEPEPASSEASDASESSDAKVPGDGNRGRGAEPVPAEGPRSEHEEPDGESDTWPPPEGPDDESDEGDADPSPEDRTPVPNARQLFRVGLVLELSLGVIGLLIGLLALDELFPFGWRMDAAAFAHGALATVPLLAYLVVAISPIGRRLRALQEIHEVLERLLSRALPELEVWRIALLAGAAGLGEEVLFRGYLEPWVGGHLTPLSSVLACAMAFALLHALTITYFLFAFGISLYFSWLLQTTENLFVPVLAHGLYDFVALLVLRRDFRQKLLEASPPPGSPD